MGKHLILDICCSNHEVMNNKDEIKNILNECVRKVNMNKLIEPMVVDGADYNPGVTGFLIIETSHISIHTFINKNKISFDLYSCEEFDENIIKGYLLSKFEGNIVNEKLVERLDG